MRIFEVCLSDSAAVRYRTRMLRSTDLMKQSHIEGSSRRQERRTVCNSKPCQLDVYKLFVSLVQQRNGFWFHNRPCTPDKLEVSRDQIH
jgi:hypothetical protein